MKEYLSYKEFKEGIGDSNIPESLFNIYQSVLGRKIDYYTFNRIDDKNIDLMKECITNLIVQVHDKFNGYNFIVEDSGRIKKSESIGQQKEDYYVPTVADIDRMTKMEERFIYNQVKLYFSHTGLMYRGV